MLPVLQNIIFRINQRYLYLNIKYEECNVTKRSPNLVIQWRHIQLLIPWKQNITQRPTVIYDVSAFTIGNTRRFALSSTVTTVVLYGPNAGGVGPYSLTVLDLQFNTHATGMVRTEQVNFNLML